MKDILGVEIEPGHRLAIAGRKGSTGSHIYFATVEEVGEVPYGWRGGTLPGLVIRLESCNRLQRSTCRELQGRAVVVGRASLGGAMSVAVYLDGASSPAYATNRKARVFVHGRDVMLEVEADGTQETAETQAEG